MRKKVLEYLKKPTAKLRAQLTTEEQNWCDKQGKGDNGGEKATPKDNKKPSK